MFTKIPLTLGCPDKISNAVLTCSVLAPPPTSRKFAGLPPLS